MGNIQTTQNLNKGNQPINKNGNVSVQTQQNLEEMVKQEIAKDFEMEKNIMDIGKKLYSEYNRFLLNPNFCDSVSLVLAKNLETIPIQTLKDHQKKLEEEGARLVIQYKPLQPNESLIVPELQDSLENPFLNQKVSQEIEFKNIKMMLPKIEYIQKRILDILEYQSKKTQGQKHQEGGKKKKRKVQKQKEEEQNNSNIDEILEELEKIKQENNQDENQEEENDEENNEDNNEENNNEENNEDENNEEVDDENDEDEKIEEEQNVEEDNDEVEVDVKEPNKISGVEEEVELTTEEEPSSFKNKGKLEDIEVEILRNERKKFNKKELDEEETTIEEIRNSNKKQKEVEKTKEETKPKEVEKPKEEPKQRQEPVILKEQPEENDENEDGKPKPISKSEICKRIAKHYTMRLNIISAILSTIPSINWQTKQPEGGFCSRRITSVREGHFCLPPAAELEKAGENEEERLKQIMRFMNYLDESSCSSAGGIYRKLDPDELNSLLYSNHQFNKLYLKYGIKLQEEYEKSLDQMRGFLHLLENEPLSNERLNELAKNVKLVINDMYTACQLNYLLALLIFIDADLRVSTEAYQQKESRRADYLATL